MAAPHDSYNAPPDSVGAASSSRHRQQAVQPPNLLTTSLGNIRNAGLGIGLGGNNQTPVSTTSLSSPFSAFPQSPGGAMRGQSPLASRSQASFSGTYNPQQWGPLSNNSTNSPAGGDHRPARSSRVVALGPRPVGPDEPVVSPPPPYSPRREPNSENPASSSADTISPSDTVSPDSAASRYGTPISAATTLSPELGSQYANGRSPVIRQRLAPNTSPNTASGAHTFPPPPPMQKPDERNHAFSINQSRRFLSSMTPKGGASNVASPVDASGILQQNASWTVDRIPGSSSDSGSTRAPAARRAASTGDIGFGGGSSRWTGPSPSSTTWEPGMPLPPPPPGPPPTGARSQSLNRQVQSSSHGLAPTLPFRQRYPPGSGTVLDTVPPTPADWKEESLSGEVSVSRPRSSSKGPSPLHIDTSSISITRQPDKAYPQTTTSATPVHKRRDSSTAGLSRNPAFRNPSAKGIRERRSESRNGKGRALDDPTTKPVSPIAPWEESLKPSDLVLQGPQPPAAKHKVLPNPTPKSGRSMQSLDGALSSAEIQLSSGNAISSASSRTTPQPESGFSQRFSASTSTPPFSPGRDAPVSLQSPALAPKSIKSPPLSRSVGPALSLVVPPESDQRPISHLLHMPNPENSMPMPLTPSTRAAKEVGDLLGPESPKAFAGRAIERHRIFAEREAAAADDSERLDLFIHYMVAESRIRRDQYASVFEEEDINVENLSQDLFGHIGTDQRNRRQESKRSAEDTSRRTSIASSILEDSSSQGDVSAAASRMHESPSSATSNSSNQHRPESNWWKDYKPSLSPIASMSIATGQDEMDSRGRAPSRWWEDQSRSGAAPTGDAFDVLGRSRRETKYMGINHNLPAVDEGRASSSTCNAWETPASIEQPPGLAPDEYPPEKVGWHEEGQPVPPPPQLPPTPRSAPPDPRRLDISRLITLPPPYPRHHPAVNNNHPDLADVRAVVRSLQEKDEPKSIKETFDSQMQGKKQRAESWCKHQRSLHTQDMEFRIEHGDMSQEDFDEAECNLEATIHRSEKEITQGDFDLFQSSVLTPLHAIFSNRIKLATSSLDKLSSRLFSDAQSRSPNLPQEEGDEQPELLEKLTQLKWLFEARESLHRQIYDLLSQRNDRYKAIVLLPFKQTQDHAKHTEAETFFAQDALERRIAFDQSASTRAQAFLHIIEANVSRGVEVQLDAFWEIAPPLLDILHKIPTNSHGFEIQIPANEYDENPSYCDHPLQYLYSLLSHAEKSSYQFIESQVNLLCLLHEIRSHTLSARCRADASSSSDRQWVAEEEQAEEERKLTEDLKEKVGVVEGQWAEALGDDLREAREKVRGWLLEEGGFDEEDV
ncbi:hypothetical protein ACLMJK_005438 [Lecanora helva]